MPGPSAILAACILVSPVMAGCSSGLPPSPAVVAASPAAPSSASTLRPATVSPSPPLAVASSRTQARIDYLVERVRTEPTDGDAQLELGLALLQRIREIGDP